MKGLIVAAGQGTRLREKGEQKPLIPIRGVPLIERVIATLAQAGLEEIVVVTGYRAEALTPRLREIGQKHAVTIIPAYNPAWQRANGVSVSAARQFIEGEFLLTMCDHLVEPDLISDLLAAPVEPGTVTLAIDRQIDRPLNDPEDVTRVKFEGNHLRAIGKVIRDFNGFDTGVFRCSPVMFEALAESQARGDDSISGGMTVLAEWDKARVFDIGSRLWLDVDDPLAFGKAEQLLATGKL
ncbi:NTP transferase domain-containing protein [Acidocella sp.]|uniref:phosphocholine cytidylyltransferase family protein n=1 Tax=Acidocella sp. TaxID=50710 RepID=UPI00262E8846|nr:NTP transferase domain-containing protein [Acidocella sp.]